MWGKGFLRLFELWLDFEGKTVVPVGEVFRHDGVYSGEAGHIREKNIQFENVIQAPACRFTYCLQVHEDTMDLCLDISIDHFHAAGIQRDLA